MASKRSMFGMWAPDRKAQASAVEMGYKLKGKLKTVIEPDDVPGLFNPTAELTIKVVDGRDADKADDDE